MSTQRGSGGARGSADRGRGSARSRGGGSGRDRGKASGTAEDLDKELDDFMSKGSGEVSLQNMHTSGFLTEPHE